MLTVIRILSWYEKSTWIIAKIIRKRLFQIVFLTGFTRGIVLKQLNYPILRIPIVFRSVDRIVSNRYNDPCRRSSRKYYYHRRPIETNWRPTYLIRDPPETNMPDQGPIGDQHIWSGTHRRPTYLIKDPSETDISDQRPMGDQHAWSGTDMPDQRLIFLIEDGHA